MDLTTTYLGLELRNPLVASAGPMTQSVDGVKALADGGAGAIVMHSLFEEQLRAEAEREIDLVEAFEDVFAEASSYFPDVLKSAHKEVSMADSYLTLVAESAAAVDVPVIASLNGSDLGGWVSYAKELAEAGAAALELNIYQVPGDVTFDGGAIVARHLDIVQAVRATVDVPVAVKLSPYFASPGNMAMKVLDAGADGLVLFNRWLAPEIDIDTLEVNPHMELSSAAEGRLPRTWIALLRNHTSKSLALTSGVEYEADVIKGLLAGADVVMTTSALIRNGAAYSKILLNGLTDWMEAREFSSVAEFRGRLAVPLDVDASRYERAGYVATLEDAKERYGSLSS